jgi:transportin-1
MLKRASESEDYANYLTYLVITPQSPPSLNLTPEAYHMARSAGAVALRNLVRTSYKSVPDNGKTYIRSVVLQGLQDNNAQIRNYTGNVVTELLRQGGVMSWPSLLASLVALVENKTGDIPQRTQEGAMSALNKVCEDNKRALDRDYSGERPLAFLFPKLIDFTRHDSPIVRATALSAVNLFLPEKSQVVPLHYDALLQRLFELANDSSSEVRKYVCRSLTRFAEITPERIVPHMQGIVTFILTQQQVEDNADLALDAAEFWLCLGEDEKLCRVLEPYLQQIVPVLLESMVYGEDDQFRLEGEQEDADVEDKAEDIKPAFATSKDARATTDSGGNGSNGVNGSAAANSGYDDDELSEGEIEEDDDEDGEDPAEAWNLRKCSAAALDVLASQFNLQVFELTLPYLKNNLSSGEWPRREAAVLAVGAIADGCMNVVQPYIPDLTSYLLTVLGDEQAVVRQIACWALGRYSGWSAHLDEEGQRQYFQPVMDALLTKMLDRNKRVQEAAASAFANLEEKAKSQLIPYAIVIVRQFVKCFAIYKDRNMYILYDCVQTLAEHIGQNLRKPELVNLLMPTLIQRWQRVNDQSREMFPLLECLSYVAIALGEDFTPFAQPIFTRCIQLIQSNLEETHQAANLPAYDQPDIKDFIVTSLDLLSGIVQALDPAATETLIASTQPNVFNMLTYCMRNKHNDVRQSSYALLGDCAIYCFPQMKPLLPAILDILLQQLNIQGLGTDPAAHAVVNNACWSLGEVAKRQTEGMSDYLEKFLQKLGVILFDQQVPQSMNENAAIAIGRLSLHNSDKIALHLADLAPHWVRSMSHVMMTEEKSDAMWGFNLAILKNPAAMETALLDYLNVIAMTGSSEDGQSAPPQYLENKAATQSFQQVGGLPITES